MEDGSYKKSQIYFPKKNKLQTENSASKISTL